MAGRARRVRPAKRVNASEPSSGGRRPFSVRVRCDSEHDSESSGAASACPEGDEVETLQRRSTWRSGQTATATIGAA